MELLRELGDVSDAYAHARAESALAAALAAMTAAAAAVAALVLDLREEAAVHAVVVGGVACACAAAGARRRCHGPYPAIAAAALGGWLALSPWLLGFGDAALWSCGLGGGGTAYYATWSAVARRRCRGWSTTRARG